MKRKLFDFILIISFLLMGCSNFADKESSILIGKVILIDPGHGGRDNGASYEGIIEDELNLSFSLMLQEKLLDEGVYAIVTRNADYDLADMYSSNRKMKDLKHRVNIINSNKVDLFISIHMNVYSSSIVNGAQVFYQQGNENSYKFASILQSNLNDIQDKKRKAMKGDYYILDNTNRDGILLELGFITSPVDREKLLKKELKNVINNTIIDSIKEYF